MINHFKATRYLTPNDVYGSYFLINDDREMTKIETMANRLDKLKEQIKLTVTGTKKNIRINTEIREQEEKVKSYWRKRESPI